MQRTGLRLIRFLLAPVLLGAGLLGCSRPPAAPAPVPQLDPSRVAVRTDTSFLMAPGQFRVYSLSDGDTHAQLRIEATAPAAQAAPTQLLFSAWRGPGPESFAPDRSLPIARRVQFLSPLFQRYLSDGGPGNSFDLFVYGFSELNDRLTLLAAQDPGWDRKHGEPRHSSPGLDYFQQLLTAGQADKEVVQALAPFHYRLASLNLEKLFVAPVSTLSPELRQQLGPGVKPDDLLPTRITATALFQKEP